MITVSVANVQNWVVSSVSASMTGPDDPADVLPLAGGLVGSNESNFGELVFGGDFSYTDINVGAVAATGLPAESTNFPSASTDLFIFWNPADSNLPGDSQPVVCVAGCTLASGNDGDFDGDGDVDGDDFKLWQQGGSPSPVSVSDLALWERDYGMTVATPNLAAVPEPTSLALIGIALCGMMARRRRS